MLRPITPLRTTIRLPFLPSKGKYEKAGADEKLAMVFGRKSKGFTLQTKCPLSDKPIDASVTTDYKGKKVYYGDAMDADSYVKGKFDVVFASHVLEHMPWHATDSVLASWVRILNPGGALHVMVPSLEWCAEEILSDNPSKALLPVLFGGQFQTGDDHLTGFTMRYLRARMEKAGLHVYRAVSGAKEIHVGEGEQVESDQHYAIGLYLPEETDLPPLEKE